MEFLFAYSISHLFIPSRFDSVFIEAFQTNNPHSKHIHFTHLHSLFPAHQSQTLLRSQPDPDCRTPYYPPNLPSPLPDSLLSLSFLKKQSRSTGMSDDVPPNRLLRVLHKLSLILLSYFLP